MLSGGNIDHKRMAYKMQMEGCQYFDKYVLIAPGSDYGRAMWSDIEKVPNAVILENALKPSGKVISFLHHIHFSFWINRKIQLPFQNVWKRKYSLETLAFEDSMRYCIIYTDVSAARTDCKYLEELQKRENFTLVLIMVNTMARRGSLIQKRIKFFSQIYSFDKKDCDGYNFIYHPMNYSITDMEDGEVEADAFYVGVSKGRSSVISGVYERLKKNNVKALFFVSGIKSNEEKTDGIHYNQWLKYKQVLEYIRKSNCIVEIMDGSQEGVTLRTMEAICYNKKLLTNNRSMRESKYFQSGYIQVFSDPAQIDVEFVKNRERVDYKYNGEFSPIHLLEHINRVKSEKSE